MNTAANCTITRLLGALSDGRDSARADLWNAVYDDLRRIAASMMARESPGHTLQPTALVNECYARLEGGERLAVPCRSYFFASATRSMRRILIERGRRKRLPRAGTTEPGMQDADTAGGVESLKHALVALAQHDRRTHDVVVMRSLADRSVDETAEALGISPRTVKRCWNYGRAWLFDRLGQDD